jgi:pyrimidine oxygenase
VTKKLDFGVFLPVGSGGFIPSSTSPAVPGDYRYNRRVTLLAEELGLGFVVSMARWRGFGGPTEYNKNTLESITATAGLAECTKGIQLFMTIHTVAIHPAVAAKMVATIDQISGGRAGVNIVAGSNPIDHGQFGIWPDVSHDELYEIAAEWATVAKALWAEDRVNHEGKRYRLTDCVSYPKPLQHPHPTLLCAATSDAGMAFTARHADASLVNGPNLEQLVQIGQHAKEVAEGIGETTKTVGLVMIVPGESDAAAKERIEFYNAGADVDAITTRIFEFSQSAKEFSKDEHKLREMRRSFTADGTPLAVTSSALVGTPATIADGLAQIIDEGDFDAIGIYLPDYVEDLKTFGYEVLPRLARLGYERAASLAAS